MRSILDIDLDYFNEVPNAPRRLEQLLKWGGCPVSVVVERHHHAFARWRKRWKRTGVAPSHILHVDEHHDMMDQRARANMANCLFHAMRIWSQCRVHWLVQYPIDSPAMWLDDETWKAWRHRFTYGRRRPTRWPKPDLVSVCTSPEFVAADLRAELTEVVSGYTSGTLRSEPATATCGSGTQLGAGRQTLR